MRLNTLAGPAPERHALIAGFRTEAHGGGRSGTMGVLRRPRRGRYAPAPPHAFRACGRRRDGPLRRVDRTRARRRRRRRAPHVIAILPDTSALEVSGYPASAALRVDVRRDGIRVGDATVTTDGTGSASVNAGTAGCWTDATPDIRPGDTVKVSGSGFSDTSTTQAVTVQPAVQTAADTVEVHGTAAAPDGTALALAGLEARITAGAAQPFSGGRGDLRAGAGQSFPLVQDAGDATHWTATFAGLAPDDVAAALATADVRATATDAASGDRTVAQAAGSRGPVAPCSAPARRQALTESSRTAVNAATAGDDLTLSGVAEDADGVTVTLDDDNPDTPAVAVPATVSAPAGRRASPRRSRARTLPL